MTKKQSASKSPKKPARAETPATSKKVIRPMNEIPGCEHFWKMKFLPERGFNFAKAHHSFLSTVNNLQWERFVQTRAYYIEQIVREFYSGIQNTKGGTIFYSKVRGKKVFFDPIRINKHYDLKYTGSNFEEMLETYGKKQMNLIKDRIAEKDSKWEKFTNTEFKLKSGDLIPELGNWHLFIASSILPTSHTSTLSKDKLILLDSILTEDDVDIGKIITNEIMDCQNKTSGFLYFPCLISELCQKQGVEITELEKIYAKSPPSGLSAEVKERLRTARLRNTAEPGVLEHLMQKLQAVWKFQKEQHDWLKVKLNDPDAEIETPVFPTWIINEEEEQESEEEEVEAREKKTKRKRDAEKEKKKKKPRVEEVIDVDEEDTEEDEEARQAVKDIEKDVEEDESESLEDSEEDDSDDTETDDMEASARKKYEVRTKSKNEAQPASPASQQSNTPSPPKQTKISSPTTHHPPTHSPTPKSPTPPPENAPQEENPNLDTQEETTIPSQKSPTLPTEPSEPTNISVEIDKLQVLTEEAEKIEGHKDSDKGKQPQAVTKAADVPTTGVKTQRTKVMETSPEDTIQQVLKALKEKKEVLGYTRKSKKPTQPKKTWTMSALYGEQGQGAISGEQEKTTPTEEEKTTEEEAEQQTEELVQQIPMQVDVSTPDVPASATPDVPTHVIPEQADIPEQAVEDPGVHAAIAATPKTKTKKEKTAPTRASPRFQKKD